MQRNTPTDGKATVSRQTESAQGHVQTITGPSERATALVEADLTTEEQQGLALFATHGLADGASTVFATAAVGAGVEANPLMATLLQQGWGFAAGAMLLVTGLMAVVYPSVAKLDVIPNWFGPALAVVGLLVAIINVVVGVAHV